MLEAKTKTDPSVGKQAVITGTPATAVNTPYQFTVTGSDEVFELLSSVVIGGGGTIPADFRAVNFGPVILEDGDSVSGGEIAFLTSVPGVTDIDINTVILGRDDESDQALRLRHKKSLQGTDGGTVDALLARILTVQGADSVFIIENLLDIADSEGRPGHSFEVMVSGSTIDQDIIDSIFDVKPLGVETFGSVSGTATDISGNSHTINFSRPVDTPVHLTITISVDTKKFPANGSEAIKEAVAPYGNDNFDLGGLIIMDQLKIPVFDVDGITDVLVEGALAGPPGHTDTNIQMLFNQDPTFAIPDIDVIIV